MSAIRTKRATNDVLRSAYLQKIFGLEAADASSWRKSILAIGVECCGARGLSAAATGSAELARWGVSHDLVIDKPLLTCRFEESGVGPGPPTAGSTPRSATARRLAFHPQDRGE